MNALVIAAIGLHFIVGQQSIGDVQVEDMSPRVANISKTTDVIITTKDDAEGRSGTIYLYDASKLVLNTAWLQKRDYTYISDIVDGIMNETLFRKDITPEADPEYFTSGSDAKNDIIVEIEAREEPTKFIIWPYSESKGWIDKLEIANITT